MLKLNAAFSKKIPVPGEDFSSQSFHASIECECADALTAEQLQAKIHDTFALVKDAVESELHGKTAAKAEPEAQPAKGEPAKPDTTKASNKQVKFITDLAAERKIPISDLNADIRKRFNVGGLYDLSSKQASALLDEMNGGGQRRRAA